MAAMFVCVFGFFYDEMMDRVLNQIWTLHSPTGFKTLLVFNPIPYQFMSELLVFKTQSHRLLFTGGGLYICSLFGSDISFLARC